MPGSRRASSPHASGSESSSRPEKRRKRTKWDSPSRDDPAAVSGEYGSAAATAFAMVPASQATAAGGGIWTAVPKRPRIYVGSLDYSISEREVMQMFSTFGKVISIDMPREGTPPRSKGFCFVEFAEQKAAELALACMKDFVLGSRKIRVGRPTAQNNPSARLVPVGRAPTAGVPAAMPVPGQHQSGMENMAIASAPMPSPASTLSSGGPTAHVSTVSGPTQSSRVLVLENLVGPGEVDEDLESEVLEECRRFGAVERVLVHEGGKPPRVRVFVRFNASEALNSAIAALHGRWFGGRQTSAVPYFEEAFARGDLELDVRDRKSVV